MKRIRKQFKRIKFYLRLDYNLNAVTITLQNSLFRMGKLIFTDLCADIFTFKTQGPKLIMQIIMEGK